MAHFYEGSEVDPTIIQVKRVAIIGFGNQGHAHALNLRDSGVDVVVGARPGVGSDKAAEHRFPVVSIPEAAEADVLVLTLPDLSIGEVFRDQIAGRIRPGQCILLAHGFSVLYGLLEPTPDVDVVLVAPKGAGAKLRQEYLEGRGLAALVAVHQDATGSAEKIAVSYAWALGSARALIMRTTFREETETDLFGEQAVLCGGIPALIMAAFEQLVEAGYQPEAAYFETLHEAKLITDLIYARGISGMRKAISDTAEWGGYLAERRVVGEEAKAAMGELLDEIRSGKFAKGWIDEDASGRPTLHKLRQERNETLEQVGKSLREKLGLS